MDLQQHTLITRKAVGEYFNDVALSQVLIANQQQDSLLNQLKGHLHFDNRIAEGLAYLHVEHATIQVLAVGRGTGHRLRAAFGRLCHTAQDFYAHTNYVALWLSEHGGLAATSPDDIDGLDAGLLHHPDLRTGSFRLWRDWVYHAPVVKDLARRIYVPAGSHEAMNLDSPMRGPAFAYAFAAACQRTRYEYRLALQAILERGGQEALRGFHYVTKVLWREE